MTSFLTPAKQTMKQPAIKPRRVQRMRQRASMLLARLYDRLQCWTGADRPGVGRSLPGRLHRETWKWLLPIVRRRTAPARKQPAPADPAPVPERQLRLVRDADLLPASPAESAARLRLREPKAPKFSPAVEVVERRATDGASGRVFPMSPGRSKPLQQRRVVAIADCENDTASVQASLRFAGLCGKRGGFKAKSRGACIVQTGDLLHKNRPNPSVVEFWEGLRAAAAGAGCALHLIAGNHELEILRRLRSRARLGLKRCDREAAQRLIRSTQLFHLEGSMLFIHGYPTVRLLRHMLAYRSDTGNSLNDYNRDHFQAAFDDADVLARYAYLRSGAYRNALLHDVPDPESYYRRHGQEVAALLGALGIDLVVHGHRPERSGVQTDYEWRRLLPGIRMISHDIQLRLQGLGATVIRQMGRGPVEVSFINREQATPSHRAEVRRALRVSKSAAGQCTTQEQATANVAISSRSYDGGFVASAVAASKS